MGRQDLYNSAQARAQEILHEMSIQALPIDPFAIAQEHEIAVEAKPSSSSGVSGMLIRHGDVFGILYATHITSEGFQRFSVGHELGHYFLDGHIDYVLPEGKTLHESRSGFVSKDNYELEADHFSASLLMPQGLFTKAMLSSKAGLQGIQNLADKCRTSLTATAIRYCQCTNDPVAIVVTTGQAVDFCFMSDALFRLDKEFRPLPKGCSIPRSTETRQFNADKNNILQGNKFESEVWFQDWFGGEIKRKVREEIIGLGTYGKTLTVLSVPEAGDEDEEESEDEDPEEPWTPRF
ncbi:MAG: ImmA/IrrE family metallo-endopeptidase [Nitrospira sp.]|nr:ImmA/IrrE family metallo-endopeptidase [Nitrospira sp.]